MNPILQGPQSQANSQMSVGGYKVATVLEEVMAHERRLLNEVTNNLIYYKISKSESNSTGGPVGIFMEQQRASVMGSQTSNFWVFDYLLIHLKDG